MKFTLLILGLCVSAIAGELNTKTTVTKTGLGLNTEGAPIVVGSTNRIFIPFGEAARVSTLTWNVSGNHALYIGWEKDGWWFDLSQGDVVTGPAVIAIELDSDEASAALITLERWKVKK
jgi:hypothetical protein